MQTIKGLIALLLVAAAVFTAVCIFNNKIEPAYEARIEKAGLASTGKTVKQAAIGKTSGTDTHQNAQKSNL